MKLETETAPAGFTVVRFKYDQAIVSWLKQLPGPSWSPPRHAWLVPTEMVPFLYQRLGVLVPVPGPVEVWQGPADLWPFQAIAVERLVADRRLLISFEPGLGKTRTFIEAVKATAPQTILVVCPASVIGVWNDEFLKWWPAGLTGTTICSYEALRNSKVVKRAWTAIAIDESHYIAAPKAQRSRAVVDLLATHPTALQALLTGTPVTTRPEGLWNQLNALWPWRFGKEWKFKNYYQNQVPDEWAHSGFRFEGLRAGRAEELADRLAIVATRVTRADAGDCLPPNIVQLVRVLSPTTGLRAVRDFTRMDWHQTEVADLLKSAGRSKIEMAVERALAAGECLDKVAVVTYTHEWADEIAEQLVKQSDRQVVRVGGESPSRRREVLLEVQRNSAPAYLVGTMMSISTGISLNWLGKAILAELHTSPGIMTQLLARFCRGGATAATPVEILVLGGTADEAAGQLLVSRIATISTAYRKGSGEAAIENAFGASAVESEDDFCNAIRDIASRGVDRGAYV